MSPCNQTDQKCNIVMGPTSHTFHTSSLADGNTKVLERAVLNDIRSTAFAPSIGYVVNDTLIIRCDMTIMSGKAPTAAAAAPTAQRLTQQETRIMDANTAAAAAIAAAYPGALSVIAAALPAAVAATALQRTRLWRGTRIVVADTAAADTAAADSAAAAVIAAVYPGALPAAAAAIAAANPGAVSGAAPRVAVPAGLYPTGTGGLLYLPAGALANY